MHAEQVQADHQVDGGEGGVEQRDPQLRQGHVAERHREAIRALGQRERQRAGRAVRIDLAQRQHHADHHRDERLGEGHQRVRTHHLQFGDVRAQPLERTVLQVGDVVGQVGGQERGDADAHAIEDVRDLGQQLGQVLDVALEERDQPEDRAGDGGDDGGGEQTHHQHLGELGVEVALRERRDGQHQLVHQQADQQRHQQVQQQHADQCDPRQDVGREPDDLIAGGGGHCRCQVGAAGRGVKPWPCRGRFL